MNPTFQLHLTKLKAGLSNTKDLAALAGWLKSNTKHPKDNTLPWSFKDHEYQLGILADPASVVIIRKCSQVGMSELSVRMALAMLGVFSGFKVIYTLPTTNFARKFTKDRIDTVIAGSASLRDLRNRDVDNSEQKQLGSSFLYLQGSFGQSSAISIPADALFRDEVDFSNAKTLSTFISRLGHAAINPDGGKGYVRDFSTPTVSKYGISDSYENSSQARYRVKHDKCGEWVAPSPVADIVIPGYDEKLLSLDKEDLDDKRCKPEDTWIKCPHCHGPISLANLVDSEKRQWVHAYPDRVKHGYQIMPYDVPTINAVADSVRSITNYATKQDWVNFEWGLPYEDAENSFIMDALDAHTVVNPVQPRDGAASCCVAGLDVGKTSWLVIQKPIGGHLDTIWAERIRQTGNDNLGTTVSTRIKQFGIKKLVVDAAPDFSTALALIEKSKVNQAFACYYVRKTKDRLSTFDLDEVTQVINADRTKTISDTAKGVNNGYIRFPKGLPATREIREHLNNMKKITRESNDGEKVDAWVSNGPDHYGMALNYAQIAANLLAIQGNIIVLPNIPLVKKVLVHTADEHAHPATLSKGIL